MSDIKTPLSRDAAKALLDKYATRIGRAPRWTYAGLENLLLAVDAASRKQAQEEAGLPEGYLAARRRIAELEQAQEPLLDALKETVALLHDEDVPESALDPGDRLLVWLAVIRAADRS